MTRTNATQAARMLEDVLKWKIHLNPEHRSVQAVRYDNDASPATGDTGLPFGLNNVIDSGNGLNHDHPDELNTTAAVDKWLRFWNPWVSYWTGAPSVYRKTPGPWYLKQLQENPVFQTIDAWDDEDQATWGEFTSELRTVWNRLRTATGNAPKRRAPCPRCKTGWLQSQPTKHGFTDEATCHQCGHTRDYNEDEINASIRAEFRDPNIDPNIHMTIAQVKVVWPNAKAGTLSKWVTRKRVRKEGDRYNLADINACLTRNSQQLC